MKPRGPKEAKIVAVADARSIAGCVWPCLEVRSYTRYDTRSRVLTVHKPWDAWLPVRLRTTVHHPVFATKLLLWQRLKSSVVGLLDCTIKTRFEGFFLCSFNTFLVSKSESSIQGLLWSIIAINSSLYLFLPFLRFFPNFYYFVMFIQLRLVIMICMMFSG